jgi:hypothetical protein
MYTALFSYVGKCGMLCHRVGGCLDGPRRDLVIMAYLVPEQDRIEGWSVADGRDAFRRARGSC